VGIARFEDLRVWKAAHQVVLATYRMTRSFPIDERFGLIQKMKRAAGSIVANIAEGFGRRRPKDRVRFYNISQASIEELRYYFRLSRELGPVKDLEGVDGCLDDTARMLKGLVSKTPSLFS